MKRTFLFLIALLFVSSNVYALTAQEILKKASAQLFTTYFDKYEAYVIEYEVNVSNQIYSGKKIVNGDKFRLDTPEISFIFDGKNYYLNSVQDDYSGNYRLLDENKDSYQIAMISGMSKIAISGTIGYIEVNLLSQNPYLSATIESTSQNQYIIKYKQEASVEDRSYIIESTFYIDKNSYLVNEAKKAGIEKNTKSEDIVFDSKYFGYTKIQGTNHYYPSKTIMLNGAGRTEAIIKSFKIVSARDIKSQFIPTKIVTAQQQKVSKQAQEKEVSKAVEDKKSSKASNAVADELVSFNKEIAKEVKSDVRHNTKSIIKSGIKHKIGF